MIHQQTQVSDSEFGDETEQLGSDIAKGLMIEDGRIRDLGFEAIDDFEK